MKAFMFFLSLINILNKFLKLKIITDKGYQFKIYGW